MTCTTIYDMHNHILEEMGVMKDRMGSRMRRRQVIRDEIATVVA